VLVEAGRVTGIKTAAGQVNAAAVILATGGPAWPAAGGTAGGLDMLAALGHTIAEPRPALAPLVIEEPWLRGLQGVSLQCVTLTIGRTEVSGPVVFTHEGLSGPVALDASLHCLAGTTVRLALMPDSGAEQLEQALIDAAAEDGSRSVRSVIARNVPRRVLDHVMAVAGMDPKIELGQLRRAGRRRLVELLIGAPLAVAAVGGWDQAMVSVGGCALGEVNPRTMESRKIGGLHVTGELLDLAGPTGGYNLHAAWATGHLAARAVLEP
jgi:predicted Rossmann fold flavoprotein